MALVINAGVFKGSSTLNSHSDSQQFHKKKPDPVFHLNIEHNKLISIKIIIHILILQIF